MSLSFDVRLIPPGVDRWESRSQIRVFTKFRASLYLIAPSLPVPLFVACRRSRGPCSRSPGAAPTEHAGRQAVLPPAAQRLAVHAARQHDRSAQQPRCGEAGAAARDNTPPALLSEHPGQALASIHAPAGMAAAGLQLPLARPTGSPCIWSHRPPPPAA